MGIKKMFTKKEPTEQELINEMQKVGISTKSTNGRQEKFGAFKNYATERLKMKPGFAPVNPYSNMNASLSNPYAQNDTNQDGQSGNGGANAQSNPYGNLSNPYGALASHPQSSQQSPYASQSGQNSSNPYGGSRPSPYSSSNGPSRSGNGAEATRQQASNPYAPNRGQQGGNGSASLPYNRTLNGTSVAGGRTANPYDSSSRSYGGNTRGDEELILDLNAIPTNQPAVQLKKPIQRSKMNDTDTLDLNDEDDLNVEVDDFLPEQEQVNSEDEEIEAIKQDIRFTKQESVALTRNTLRMAQEADASGINTLGMLGSQSERLYNAEQNLLLADTQTKIADDKVSELKRLNRSIFVPATGNPFNKKLRLRQQEAKMKTQKEQEKYLRETNRQGMYASEQRVKQGITNNATNSDTYNKYQDEKYLLQAKRYQFDADSEDDDMEKEIGSNLDQISSYAKKLQSTALTMNKEVDAQNERLRKIEEDADRLDINVHLNSTRLNNIR
ncbi:CIC11C00000002598 [Sungouiella intermedia]|uniref:CIC11C00000002598 n=1 Tax=Sungouiella intermedia TaxID=45354 RepID=A0A1L0D6U4_9ASCO|nr:CIC11C00000002598 [[Candida] intermedia]